MPNLNRSSVRSRWRRRLAAAVAGRTDSRNLYGSLQTSVQQLEDSRRLRDSADEQFQRWEIGNTTFESLRARDVTVLAMCLASLAAASVIDSMLLVDAAREITKGYSTVLNAVAGNAVWPALIASAAFALSFILLEVAIGNRLSRERETGQTTLLTGGLAFIAWLILPIIIVGITLSNSGLLSPDPTRVIGPATYLAGVTKIVGVALAALVVHGFVLWNGERFLDAFSYFFVYLPVKIYRHRYRLRLANDESRMTTYVETDFRDLHEVLSGYHETRNDRIDGQRVQSGPFGERTRETVNRVFGQEVIEGPNRSPDSEHEALERGEVAEGDRTAVAADSYAIATDYDTDKYVYNMTGEDEVRR